MYILLGLIGLASGFRYDQLFWFLILANLLLILHRWMGSPVVLLLERWEIFQTDISPFLDPVAYFTRHNIGIEGGWFECDKCYRHHARLYALPESYCWTCAVLSCLFTHYHNKLRSHLSEVHVYDEDRQREWKDLLDHLLKKSSNHILQEPRT